MKPNENHYPPVAPPPHSHKITDIEDLLKALSGAQGPISIVDAQSGVPLVHGVNTAEDAYFLLEATGVAKGAFFYMNATNDDYMAVQAGGPSSGWATGRIGDDGFNIYVDNGGGMAQAFHIDTATKVITTFGNVDLAGNKLVNVGDPTAAGDGVNKAYVDGIAVNLGKRQTVRVATTANVTISTALNNGDSLDGVTLVTGDLVLVKNQTTTNQNGIYVVGVSPARADQFDTYNEHSGALVVVQEGTTQADTVWLCTSNAGGTLNTTAIAFSQMTVSGAALTANNLSDLANAGTARTNLGLGNVDNTSNATERAATRTLTNARITKRLTSVNAPGATPTSNTDTADILEFTGLAAAITSMTTNLSGTPINGDMREFIFLDNGTARAITWGASFANGGLVNLPTTTVLSVVLRVMVQYQTIASLNKWVCVGVA